MSTAKIRLAKNKETYLATLYGKALDADAKHSILRDRYAAEAVAHIEYDFSKLNLPKGGEISLPFRARHFDQWTRAFLAAHPTATVLHLGCGLDTRVFRIDPGPQVRWYDVDLPDVIALREQLYPQREHYQMIRASVTDQDWLQAMTSDAPVCVVAEGLMMYLAESDAINLFRRICQQFPSGEIMFDAYSSAMVRLVSRLATVQGAQVELLWGVGDPHDVERQVLRLRLAEVVPFLAMPEMIHRLSPNWLVEASSTLLALVPFYRSLVRHVRYEW